MRFFLPFLLLFSAAPIFSQNANPDPVRRHARRLCAEKMHVRDLTAAVHWLQQHPGQALPAAFIGENKTSATQRSAEVIVHDDAKAESEVHAAVNPADTNNIIAAAILQDPDNFFEPLRVTVYRTLNFGQNWQSANITFNPTGNLAAGGGDPVLAFDNNGKAYLSWLVLTFDFLAESPLRLALYLSTSTNKGQTWSAPTEIAFGEASLDVIIGAGGSGSLVDKQWMAADQSNSANAGQLYVSYTQFDILDSVTAVAQILVKTKPQASATFGPAVPAHQGAYGIVQFSSIDVDAQGFVHVLFFAGNSDNDVALYHALSTDGGASFQPETKISDLHFPGLIDGQAAHPIDGMPADRLYPCPHLAASATPGTVYATWSADGLNSQQATAGYDVWFAKSTDGGQSWGAPFRVNPGPNPATEQYYPAIAVNDNGAICLAYYDRGGDPGGTETHYAVAFSTDEGATFSPAVHASSIASDFASIGDLNGGFGIGEYTQVVCTGSFAVPVWSDGRSNNGDIDLYAAVLPIGGQVSDAGEIGSVTDAFALRTPNPAHGRIQLQIELEKPSRIGIRILTADGKTVFTETPGASWPAGLTERHIAVPAGIYFCRVETDFGFKIRRIVVE